MKTSYICVTYLQLGISASPRQKSSYRDLQVDVSMALVIDMSHRLELA